MAQKNKKTEPHSEKKEVELNKCKHTDLTVKDGRIECSCGAGWQGARLSELENLLKKRSDV